MMKKLVAILIALLAIQSYGVYGRAQADKITHTCEWEVGPLCYYWKKNVLGELLGEDAAEELNDKLEAAKKAWEEDFVDRLARGAKKKNSIERALEDVKEAIEDAGKAMREAFGK